MNGSHIEIILWICFKGGASIRGFALCEHLKTVTRGLLRLFDGEWNKADGLDIVQIFLKVVVESVQVAGDSKLNWHQLLVWQLNIYLFIIKHATHTPPKIRKNRAPLRRLKTQTHKNMNYYIALYQSNAPWFINICPYITQNRKNRMAPLQPKKDLTPPRIYKRHTA